MSGSWWIDNESFDRAMPNETYLCEGDDGDTIRLAGSEPEVIRALCDEFNTLGASRAEADNIFRDRGLA